MINLKKKFLVYGYGVSGKSISKYLENKKSEYNIYDDYKIPNNLKNTINKKNLIKNIKTFDYFVVSPSIKIDKNHFLFAFKKKIIIDLDFLYLEINKQIIIGVTGTEGKSTTCQYLSQSLSRKYKNIIIGNFGKTILEKKNIQKYLKNFKIIIIELSSYQLDKIKFLKLDHALITNIYSDHLEYHKNFKNYVKSKFKIQSFLKINGFFYIRNIEYRSYSHLINNKIKKVNKIRNIKTKGTFINKLRSLNIPMVSSVLNKIDKSIIFNQSFIDDLPFRNQLIRKTSHYKIYNDSKCTNLENAVMKNNLIKNDKKILILGGRPKFSNNKIVINNSLTLIFGPYAKKISKNLFFKKSKFIIFRELEDLLNYIKILSLDNRFKIILFSPGGESFDQFKDFKDRGKKFNSLVKKLNL